MGDTSATDPVNPRRVTVLSIDQDPESSILAIFLQAPRAEAPSELWAEVQGKLTRVGRFRRAAKTIPGDVQEVALQCEIDVDQLVAELLPPLPEDHFPDPESEEGLVLRFHLAYTGLYIRQLKEFPKSRQERGNHIGLQRLGGAEFTEFGPMRYRTTQRHRHYVHVTGKGEIVVEIDREHRPYARIHNDSLKFESGVLKLRGRIESKTTSYDKADLVVLGRTSGFKATRKVRLKLDTSYCRENFGLRKYDFTARLDFLDYVDEIEDDTVDLYLDLYPEVGGDVKRKRYGKSRYLVRREAGSDAVTNGDRTVAITTYYTFHAKNPSLALEVFKTSNYDYLQKELSTSGPSVPIVKELAHRPGFRNLLASSEAPVSGGKPVWLIGELPYKAQDNGLQFFQFMRDNHPEIDAYYVIRPDSPERRNLEGYDHVLDFRSEEHIRVTLEADKIVSTHNPNFLYPSRDPRFEAALKARFVFLQHGVTAAKWMVPNYGKQAAGFRTDLICVNSEREKEFFVKDFGYRDDEVAITGFARFDALLAQDVEVKKKQLMIMPTWRAWLQDPESFTESDYFQRWSNLIASPRFREIVDRYDLEPVFCLHPNMQQFSSYFSGNGVRVVVQGEIDVQFLLKQSGMLITDYSSVAFDFSFLHKPVAYYQFDMHRFQPPHADPLKEFPGPVVDSEDVLLGFLERCCKRDFAMLDVFKERADRFLRDRDQNSRERIFQAIVDMPAATLDMAELLNSEGAQALYKVARKDKNYLPVMKKAYKAMRKFPLDENFIVFESGQGKQFGDSPRAIYEELIRRGDTRKKVWIYHKSLPYHDPNTIVVKRHSPLFFWYLATAKYWVNNHNFPCYIHRRKGGVYIQTWHGTPLKRMFLDQDNYFGRDDGYVGRVKEATAQWNALVSPSAYAAFAMKSAYAYEGPVYELGYPRNDVLRGPDTKEIRANVRQQLGIPKDKTVVLYAPTFRDDKPLGKGKFSFSWPFDPEEFVSELGEDVVLVVRTHVLIGNKLVIPEHLRDNIKDASGFPDIQHLFLASDMLVTDYSSSFFDYSVLERPIIFFAYDLRKYRDQLRGFYLDYNTELPGPIARKPRDLYKAIQAASRISYQQKVELRDFARTYAPFDDGHAAARVVDTLMGGIKVVQANESSTQDR